MSVFIGVDGGGTSTRAVVVDREGHELGRAVAGGAVATSHDPSAAARAVSRAVRDAAEVAGVQLPAAVLWAGLAGAGPKEAREGVTKAILRLRLADQVHVGTDVEAAFHDAFPQGPGMLLIAGTGSIAWVASAEKGDVAALAPVVVAAADAGDAGAEAVVARAVDALVAHVRASAALLGGERPAVVLWGGLVADQGPLRTRVANALEHAGWGIDERRLDPVRGAAYLALESRPPG